MDVSHLVTFLIGTLTGAAGHYLGEKYSDQRREKESARRRTRDFKLLLEKMPALLKEMHGDLQTDSENMVREFFVMPSKGAMIGLADKKRFRYNENEHESLREKLDFLERAGFIDAIRRSNAPIYRLEEHFVELLRKELRRV